MAKTVGASGKYSKPSSSSDKARKRKHSEISGSVSERKSSKKRRTSDDSPPRKHGKGKFGKNYR